MEVLAARLARLSARTPHQHAQASLLTFFHTVLDLGTKIHKQCETPEKLDAFLDKCIATKSPTLFKKASTMCDLFEQTRADCGKAREAEEKRQLRAEKKRSKAVALAPAAATHAPVPVYHIHLPAEAVKAIQKGGKRTKKTIPKSVKERVWRTYVGDKTETPCPVCLSERISILSFHAGHVIAESNGGDSTVANLRPICHRCNLQMGSTNMEEYCWTWYKRRLIF